MTAVAVAKDPAETARANRFPVPRSNVAVDILISVAESKIRDHGPVVAVRCGGSGHRLYDLRAEPGGLRSLVITRICPRCGRRNSGRVTHVVGHPLDAPDALDDDWRCDCGCCLGRVDAVRGRITVRCRHCKIQTRVTAACAMAVAYRAVA